MTPTRARRLFAVLLAVVAVYRFSLLDRGATAFVDETLYFTSVMALQSIAAGDVHAAMASIAAARGRPAAALMQLPVAALQAIPSAFGIPASNLRSLLIPTTLNVVVSLVTLSVFFWISCTTCGDAMVALAASVCYALLVNTNLYVRHLVPYDLALLAAVLAIRLQIRHSTDPKSAVMTGILAGLVVATYAGYVLFAAAVGAALVVQEWSSRGWRQALAAGTLFAAGAGAIVAAIESLLRLGGVSYVESSRVLGRTITMGSFDEGWTFLPEYLVRVERLGGITLLAGLVWYLWRAVSRLRGRSMRPVDWLILAAIGAWACEAALSTPGHRIVLYGRLIHPWLLVMALALADAVAAIPREAVRRAVCAAMVLASVLSWAPSAVAFHRLAYPPDVLYALGIDSTQLSPDQIRCDLVEGTSYASPAPLDRRTGSPYTGETDFVLINFCQALGLMEPPTGVRVSASGRRLYDGPHWMGFPAYGYEGLPPAVRKAFAREDYRVQVYRLDAGGR